MEIQNKHIRFKIIEPEYKEEVYTRYESGREHLVGYIFRDINGSYLFHLDFTNELKLSRELGKGKFLKALGKRLIKLNYGERNGK